MRFERYKWRIRFAAVVAATLVATTLTAQEEEKKLGWADAAEVSFIATGGNAEARTLGLRNSLTHTWENALFTFDAAALRASTGTVTRTAVGSSVDDFDLRKETISAVTAENYLLRGRYDRAISDRLFWYGGLGWDRNVFAGIQNRYEGIGGLGNNWFDEDRRRFRTAYGISVIRQDDVVFNPEVDQTYAALRVSSDYMRKLGSNTEYVNTTVLNENLNQTEDLRIDMINAFAVSLSDRLALKLSHQILFDNLPSLQEVPLTGLDGAPVGPSVLVPLEKFDTIFNIALVLAF